MLPREHQISSRLMKPADSILFSLSLFKNTPSRQNTLIVVNSTGLYGNHIRHVITVSPVTSPMANIVTIESDTNEPTIPQFLARQSPIILPNLNSLNLPPNPFNVLATMAVMKPATSRYVERARPIHYHHFNLDAADAFEYSTRLGHIFRRRTVLLCWTQATLFCLKSYLHAVKPKKTEAKIEHWSVFSSKGRGCRSTPAMAAVNPYQQKRHPYSQIKHRLSEFPLDSK